MKQFSPFAEKQVSIPQYPHGFPQLYGKNSLIYRDFLVFLLFYPQAFPQFVENRKRKFYAVFGALRRFFLPGRVRFRHKIPPFSSMQSRGGFSKSFVVICAQIASDALALRSVPARLPAENS